MMMEAELVLGRNRVILDSNDWLVGGGRLRMDLPGMGIVTADEEGVDGDETISGFIVAFDK